jgi:hypothetical protein
LLRTEFTREPLLVSWMFKVLVLKHLDVETPQRKQTHIPNYTPQKQTARKTVTKGGILTVKSDQVIWEVWVVEFYRDWILEWRNRQATSWESLKPSARDLSTSDDEGSTEKVLESYKEVKGARRWLSSWRKQKEECKKRKEC